MIRGTIAFLFLSLPTLLIAQKKSSGLDIFTINKKGVTTEEFAYLFKKNHPSKGDFTEQKMEEYLTLFINFKLKVEEALNRRMDTTSAFKKEFNTYKEELRKPYLPETRVIDSLVRLTYDRLKSEVRASHILVTVSKDARPEDTLKAWARIQTLRQRALNGEDFNQLALENSEDQSARVNKGDLGYFTAMQMVYPFEVEAYQTPVGQISNIVRTQFGYHIIRVADKRPARGEIEVSHIMLRTTPGASDATAKNTIFEVYEKLQKGVAWNELVKEYSEDQSSREAGGRLRPFGVGVMSSIPEFEKAAFELERPGQVSDPFKTAYGWHIVRLEQKIPLPSLETLMPSLKGRVSRDERLQVSKQALTKRYKSEYKFAETPARHELTQWADSTLSEGRWKKKIPNATGTILFRLNGKDFTLAQFQEYAAIRQRANAFKPAEYIEQLYQGFVEESLNQEIEQGILRQYPEYGWLVREYFEGMLLFEIMEKEVWNKASEDTVGQLRFYTANASRYDAGERMRGHIYAASHPAKAKDLLKLLEAKDSVALSRFVSENKIRDDEGTFEKAERAALASVAFKPGVYESQQNGVYYVIAIEEVIPPGKASFREARAEVITDYQNDLEQRWVAALKKKYKLKVNSSAKGRIFAELKKST